MLIGLFLAIWTTALSTDGTNPLLIISSMKQSTWTTLQYLHRLCFIDPHTELISITTLMVTQLLSKLKENYGLFKPINKDMVSHTNLADMALTLVDLNLNHNDILENWHAKIVTLLPDNML